MMCQNAHQDADKSLPCPQPHLCPGAKLSVELRAKLSVFGIDLRCVLPARAAIIPHALRIGHLPRRNTSHCETLSYSSDILVSLHR